MLKGTILALAPHTDDIELGCGATLARLVETGCTIHVAAFSTAQESLPAGSSPDRLKNEFIASMDYLGLPASHTRVYDYQVRKLSYFRQDVLENLVELRSLVKPDAVLLPSGSDLHQDHQVLFNEGLRAFKDVTLWGYELPWNHISFSAQAFVTLEERHLEKKWGMLQFYHSQLEQQRPYFEKEFIYGLAKVRGTQVKARYAEAFEVLRVKI